MGEKYQQAAADLDAGRPLAQSDIPSIALAADLLAAPRTGVAGAS